jgi:hypothetical protein
MIPTLFTFMVLVIFMILTCCAAAVEKDASRQKNLAAISLLSFLIIMFMAAYTVLHGTTPFSSFHDQSGNYYLFYYESGTFGKIDNHYYTKAIHFDPVIYKRNLFYYSEYIDIKSAKITVISNSETRVYYAWDAIPIDNEKSITVVLDGFIFHR